LKHFCSAIGFITLAFFSAQAQASSVNLDTWYQFAFDSRGGLALSCVNTGQRCLVVPNTVQVGDPSWTIPGPLDFDVTLIVTDSFQTIDLFELINNGQPVTVSAPAAAASVVGGGAPTVCNPADPMTCVTDPSVQSLMTIFPAGDPIAFDIVVRQFGDPIDGSAFFMLTGAPQAVPEPSTWLLVGAGLALAAIRRRRS